MVRQLSLILCLLLSTVVAASTNFDEGIIVSYDPVTGKLVLVAYNHYAAEKKQAQFQESVTLKITPTSVCSLDGDFVKPEIALQPNRKIFVFGKGRGKPVECAFVVSEFIDVWRGAVTSIAGDTLQLSWQQKTTAKDFPVVIAADASGKSALKPGAEVEIHAGRAQQVIAALSADSLPPAPVADRAHTAAGVITAATGNGLIGKKFTAEGWVDVTVPLSDGKGSLLISDHRMLSSYKKKGQIEATIKPGQRFCGFCYRKRVWPSMFHLVTGDDAIYGTIGSVDGSNITVVGADGSKKKVSISDAQVTLDGTASKLGALKPGMRIRVFAPRQQKIVAK